MVQIYQSYCMTATKSKQLNFNRSVPTQTENDSHHDDSYPLFKHIDTILPGDSYAGCPVSRDG
jgi:hypothetical protein